MAKLEASAFIKLKHLIDSGKTIQITNMFNGCEITVWQNQYDQLNHKHYNGSTLLEAVLKIKDD